MAETEPKVVQLAPKRPDLHIAAYGGPGARKTTFFATMPQPIIVAHFDAVGKDMPYWKLGIVGEVKTDKHDTTYREITNKDGSLACRIEYYADPLVDEPKAATAFLERLNRLPKEIERGTCATFAFETVTSASLKARKMYEYDLKPNAKDPRKWYGGAVDVLEEVLLIQLPGLHCNVCVGLHVSKVKVEAEGTMVRAPLLPGRLMESFASQWPEIVRAYIERDGDTKVGLLQTQSDDRWEATTQIDAPDPCLGNYKALWVNWDKALKKRMKDDATT
jgi:hypothetical protein